MGRPLPSSAWLWTVFRSFHLWCWARPAGASLQDQRRHSSQVGTDGVVRLGTVARLHWRPRLCASGFCAHLTFDVTQTVLPSCPRYYLESYLPRASIWRCTSSWRSPFLSHSCGFVAGSGKRFSSLCFSDLSGNLPSFGTGKPCATPATNSNA